MSYSLYDWVYEARKQIKERFTNVCLYVTDVYAPELRYFVISRGDYIYKVSIWAQEFIPSLADPVDEVRKIIVLRMDTENQIFEEKVFDDFLTESSIEEAIDYIASDACES